MRAVKAPRSGNPQAQKRAVVIIPTALAGALRAEPQSNLKLVSLTLELKNIASQIGPRRCGPMIGLYPVTCLLATVLLSCALAVAHQPAGFDELAAQAATARDAGAGQQAVALYAQALRLNSSWAEGWWYLGSLQYSGGDYPQARDALTHYIALSPAAGPATALRGLCEFETGEYPQALKDIQSGLANGAANQPRNERILRAHEALLLTRAGRFEDALRTYAFFAKAGAPDPEMAEGIGLAGLRKPLLPREIDQQQHALYEETGNALFHFIEGDATGAKAAFEVLLARYPAAANLHYVYGYYLFASDPQAGVAEFERELEVWPANAADEAMLAWAALMRDNAREALPYAKKATTDDPALPLGQLVFGRALAETGALSEAMAHLERALQLDPGNLENHLALARAYSEAGRAQDARRERLQCLQMTKDQPVAQL